VSAHPRDAASLTFKYAAQRTLGLVTVGLCRPIPFRKEELPGILSSLIGKLFARRAEIRQDEQGLS
jgi:uncharacterized membrane protein YcjF (UPF0283 family)